MEKINLLSISVCLGGYGNFIRAIAEAALAKQSSYTCLVNVHTVVEAYQDKDFASFVQNASIIAPDGMPLTWALFGLYGIHQKRIAGMDLLPDLLKEATEKNIKVYFYGGTSDMLEKTSRLLKYKYNALSIAGMYSPPFRTLTQQEEEDIVQKINGSGAQMVFVILGCPKQERWMALMVGRIQCMMVGVGGALPVLVGDQLRAPKWMQRFGLEWLHRLAQEPGRLFKRYAFTNSIFLYLLVKEYVSKILLHRA